MKNGAAIPPPGAMPPGMMMPGMPGMPMPGSMCTSFTYKLCNFIQLFKFASS